LREIAQSEKVAVSDGALSLAGRQAQGSMRDALSLLDQLFSAHDPAAGEISDREAAETLGALDASVVRETVAAVLARDPAAAMAGSLPELVAKVEALARGTVAAPPAQKPEPRKGPPPGWGARVLAPDAAPLRAAPKAEPEPASEADSEPEPEARPLDLKSRWR